MSGRRSWRVTAPAVASSIFATRSAVTLVDPFSHWEIKACVAGEPAAVSSSANRACEIPLAVR